MCIWCVLSGPASLRGSAELNQRVTEVGLRRLERMLRSSSYFILIVRHLLKINSTLRVKTMYL